jgi:hypothetical protein
VRRPDTRAPIDGVNVTLYGSSATQRWGPFSALTDREGRFRFANLAAGTYSVRAEKNGYVIKEAVQQGAPNTTTVAVMDVTVGGSQNNSNAVLELIPGGTIIGRVLDANGNPMPGARVDAMEDDYSDGYRVLRVPLANRATTNDRGEFRIWGTVPGSYYVRVLARGSISGSIPVYSPSALDPRNAHRATVRADEESRADIHVPAASLIKISGQVTGPAAALSNGVQFDFSPRDPDLWDSAASQMTGPRGGSADGKFELSLSKPGLYDLFAVAMTGTRGTRGPTGVTRGVIDKRYVGRVLVDVRDRDIENVTIPLLPDIDIQTRVVTANGDRAVENRYSSHLTLQAIDAFSPRLGSRRETATANQSNRRTLSVPTDGRFFVNLQQSGPNFFPDVYVADIRQGLKSVYEDGVVVVNRSNPETIEVTVARFGGTIEGVVQDSTSRPVALSMVTLVPDGPRRKNPIFYKSVQSGSDGQFTIQGVAPGSYKIFAWANIPRDAERNAEFMKSYETLGRPLSIGANSRASNVTLSVIRRSLQ